MEHDAITLRKAKADLELHVALLVRAGLTKARALPVAYLEGQPGLETRLAPMRLLEAQQLRPDDRTGRKPKPS